MLDRKSIRAEATNACWGDVHSLSDQIGDSCGLSDLTRVPLAMPWPPAIRADSLRQFLGDYRRQILVPCEFPAIYRAYRHANCYEIRELIALDSSIISEATRQPFAWSSQRAGTLQLKRLRPLRDQRLVQRYLRAVENGEAYGWHTVVYGLILSIYSLPIREGLLHYGRQTIGTFIEAADRPLKLGEQQCCDLHREFCAELPQDIESLLTQS